MPRGWVGGDNCRSRGLRQVFEADTFVVAVGGGFGEGEGEGKGKGEGIKLYSNHILLEARIQLHFKLNLSHLGSKLFLLEAQTSVRVTYKVPKRSEAFEEEPEGEEEEPEGERRRRSSRTEDFQVLEEPKKVVLAPFPASALFASLLLDTQFSMFLAHCVVYLTNPGPTLPISSIWTWPSSSRACRPPGERLSEQSLPGDGAGESLTESCRNAAAIHPQTCSTTVKLHCKRSRWRGSPSTSACPGRWSRGTSSGSRSPEASVPGKRISRSPPERRR